MTDGHEIVPRADVLPPAARLHPMVERVLAQNPTPEAMGQLMALQREWEAGEAKRAFTRALVELRRDLPTWIAHDTKVDFEKRDGGRVNYTHTSLKAAMEAVTPALLAHGFTMTWKVSTDKGGVSVTARLTHREGHTEESTLAAPPDTSGAKSPAQAIASTITLLERYSGLAALGIATADMGEPRGEATEAKPNLDAIDSKANLRLVGEIVKAGRKKEDAEKLVGRAVRNWTAADLERIRAWLAPPAAKAAVPAPPATAPSKTPFITKEEGAQLKKSCGEFRIDPQDLGTLIANLTDAKPASFEKIPQSAYSALLEKFARLRAGEINLDRKALRFVGPPEREPGADAEEMNPPEVDPADIPF